MYEVKWLVNRMHVATPHREVADEIMSRVNHERTIERIEAELDLHGPDAEREYERQLRDALKCAMETHDRNFAEYCSVMGGSR